MNKAEVEKWRERNRDTGCELWVWLWSAVELFSASLTQWRRAGMAGIATGLDYPGVEAAARMMGIAVTPRLFRDLQTMEAAALGVFQEALKCQ